MNSVGERWSTRRALALRLRSTMRTERMRVWKGYTRVVVENETCPIWMI
jgi:hypothetical protein